MDYIPEDLKKTKEMEKFETETGKRAIWRGSITESYKKWQKGEIDFEIDKERISLYISKDVKDEWLNFANNNNYSTLSKLIRESLNTLAKLFSKYL